MSPRNAPSADVSASHQDEGLWSLSTSAHQHESDGSRHLRRCPQMKQPLIWIAVVLMLTGAVLLVLGVGAAGIWIAVVTVGIALVAVDGCRHRRGPHHV